MLLLAQFGLVAFMWLDGVLFFPKACLHVACVVQQKDARQWFAELSVDMDKVRLTIWWKISYYTPEEHVIIRLKKGRNDKIAW